MKPICGITAARKKDRPGRDDKVGKMKTLLLFFASDDLIFIVFFSLSGRLRHGGESSESLRYGGFKVLGTFDPHQLPGKLGKSDLSFKRRSLVGRANHNLFLLQIETYQTELEDMKNMTRQEYVAHLRR